MYNYIIKILQFFTFVLLQIASKISQRSITLVTIFKLLLMLISTIGTWEWLRRKTNVNAYFVPSLTIAVQVTVLFAAGILNFLLETAIVLFAFGIVVFIFFLLRKETRGFLSHYFKTGFIFLLIASIVMLIAIRGKHFGHIDNFTHWATVVKELLHNDRFPNFSDDVIGFPAYPLGSSSYIYYFSRFVGTSETLQMFAQIYMMLTCILPLFIYCKNNKPAVFILFCVLTNFFFVYNITVTNLLVDTLLPLAGMCGFLFVYFYGRKAEPKETFYACTFYMIWTMQIKNSGVFFVLMMILELFFIQEKHKSIVPLLICSGMPFLSLLLWQKHFKLVFENAEKSKHAMTITNLSDIFLSKSQKDFQEIIDHISQFLSSWKDIRLMILLIILIGIIVFLTGDSRKDYLKVIFISIIMFAAYQLGLLGMYVFSMAGEGLYPIVTERYDKTIMIAIIYLFVTLAIKCISKDSTRKLVGSMSSLVIITFFLGFMKISQGEIRLAGKHYDVSPWFLSKRMWIEKHKTDFVMEEDDTYCILTRTRDESNYMGHAAKYIFYTGNVNAEVITNMEMMDKVTEEFIFIYDDNNEIIQEWVRNHYPEQIGNAVIRRWDLYPSVN